MNVSGALNSVGIQLRSYAPGVHYVLCPQCSHMRKSHNKKKTCLSVTIGAGDPPVWHCHNCQWETPKATDDSPDAQAFWGAIRNRDEPRRQSAPASRPPQPKAVTDELMPLKGSAKRWLESRGISGDAIERLQVSSAMKLMPQRQVYGSHPTMTLAFPYFEDGKIVDCKFRTDRKDFAHSHGARKILYNLDSLIGKEVAVILEGEIDVLSAVTAGVDEWAGVVSLPDGAPEKIRDDELEQMDKRPDPETDSARYQPLWHAMDKHPQVKRWILAGDGDTAGLALRQQIARRIGKEKCAIADWPSINDCEMKDANEILANEGAQVLRECIENAHPYPISGLYRVSEFTRQVEQLYLMGRPRTTSTGWKKLDNILKIPDSALMVVTGVPGQGKSEFVDSLCTNLARNEDWMIAFCSMENRPGDDHIPKLIQKFARKPFFQNDLTSPRVSREEIDQAMAWAEKHFVFLAPGEKDNVTIDWILERAQRAVNMFGIRMLVIDPYNEVERTGADKEVDYLSQMLGKVKAFNKRNGVVTTFVAHPTKMQRDRNGVIMKPSLYDIAAGAHWFNKMDIGIIVDREWDEFESLDGKKRAYRSKRTAIDVRKVRFNWIGRPGTVTLSYDEERSEYSDRNEDDV